ncbi:uncharacterized protein JCM15063_005530 [Sporobolomyces koalae]|uniref:uncharacterized protein n=1 Tax=Sporobolomyces koalae TaxID=500713 RepID=UPI0031794CF9
MDQCPNLSASTSAAPALVTPPWTLGSSKPPWQASLESLQQYCKQLGLPYRKRDTKAILKGRLSDWTMHQRELREQLDAARKPRPRPNKRPAPSSTSDANPSVLPGEIAALLAAISDESTRNLLAACFTELKHIRDLASQSFDKQKFDMLSSRLARFPPSKRQRVDQPLAPPYPFPSSRLTSSASPVPDGANGECTRLPTPPAPCDGTIPDPRRPLVLRYNPNGPFSTVTAWTSTSTSTSSSASTTLSSTPPSDPQLELSDVPSPRRLSSLSQPTVHDLILPLDLAAFSANFGDPPSVPAFPSPASFAMIFDAVRHPDRLFRTYGPKNAGEYVDVYEMLSHWEEGIVGIGAGGNGRLPAIRDVESRFGPQVAGSKKSWVSMLAAKVS